MRILRHFTIAGIDPLASLAFKHVDVDLCHSDPDEHCCITDVEVPAEWSHSASQLFAKHFLAREKLPALTLRVEEKGVPSFLQRCVADKDALAVLPLEQRSVFESSARQVFRRLAGAWTYHGFKVGYFDTVEDAQAYYDEMLYVLAHRMAAPNSLQWRHNGIFWAYGVEGPVMAGFAVADDGQKLVKANRAYMYPQLHASMLQQCKAAAGEDALLNVIERDRKVMRFGASSACNVSAVTAEQNVDAVGFIVSRDKAAAQSIRGGFARKPMMMCVVDASHKDAESVLRFKPEEHYKAAAMMLGAKVLRTHLMQVLTAAIACKADMKDKVLLRSLSDARKALVPQAAIERVLAYVREGYTQVHIPIYGNEDGSSLFDTIGGQHTRLALRMRDADMLQSSLLEEWEHSAWAGAEPGIMFADTIARSHTCPMIADVQSMSPAGEFMFLDNTALPLAAVNADAFMTDDGAIAMDALRHVSRMMAVMLDISVDMAQYPTRDMARMTADTRPLGLSMINVSAVLMRHGIAYDSVQGRNVAAALAGLMTAEAYSASAEMAKELGAFKHYDVNRQAVMSVLNRHRQAAQQMQDDGAYHGLMQLLHRVWDQALIWAEAYGVRNAQTTCIAPMETIARLMDAVVHDAAPLKQYVFLAPQRDGRARKYVHEAVVSGMISCGYGLEERADVMAFLQGHATLVGCDAISHAMLKEKRFGADEIDAIEDALNEALDISQAFDPWIVGERFCRKVLGLTDKELFDASFDLLAHLGFSAAQIAGANMYACGSKSMQGAPHIAQKHMGVFALYSPHMNNVDSGVVSADAQIEMLAALQPMVSGGIAHMITLPFIAPMEMFSALARKAYVLGLKSISLSRHASQLYADVAGVSGVEVDDEASDQNRFSEVHHSALMAPLALAKHFARSAIAARRELPQRRNGFTQKVAIAGQTLYLRTGEYESGEVGEVFVDMPQMSEEYRALMQQYARLVSLALQYDVPLATLARAFCDMPFAPSGEVVGSPAVSHASSVLDYIFKELVHSYGSAVQDTVADDGRVMVLTSAAKAI